MSGADHETAIREALESLLDERLLPPTTEPSVVNALAALDALVGLRRQTEQERDEAQRQAVGRKMQMHEYRQENEFMKRERSRLQQEVERLKRENQERETANAVEVEAGDGNL